MAANTGYGAPGYTTGDPTGIGGFKPLIDQDPWEDPYTQDAWAELSRWLDEWGLGGLTEWAREQITGGTSPSQVATEIYETPEFKERFPAIELRQKEGLAPISPAEYIEYEQRARQMMVANGLPSGFYDQASDFTDFISKDISLVELEDRVVQGYRKVTESGIEVRAAFANYYGVNGDDMLAALFLDPDRAAPILEKQAQSAEIGGIGERFGMDLARYRAERLADLGVDKARAEQGFGRLAQIADTFKESAAVTDQQDLTAEESGISMEFEGDPNARRAIQTRAMQREATTQGGGGAQVSQEGSGIGRAERT